jgi:hypothetical protein
MHVSSQRLQILKSMEQRAPAATTWAEQWDELKIMWHAGVPADEIAENLNRSVSAVLTQATRLGLARRTAPGRKSKHPPATAYKTNVIAFKARHHAPETEEALPPRHKKQDRSCLMCSTSFVSHGSHNRICPRCKSGAAYQVGHEEAYKVMTA